MARNWREIRAAAVAQGRVDPKRADRARRKMRDAVRTHHLDGGFGTSPRSLDTGKAHAEIATMMDNGVRGKRKSTKRPTE